MLLVQATATLLCKARKYPNDKDIRIILVKLPVI